MLSKGLEADLTTETTATTAALRAFSICSPAAAAVSCRRCRKRPAQGFYWIACTREALAEHLAPVQACLQAVTGASLLDLHVSDLLNVQRPSGMTTPRSTTCWCFAVCCKAKRCGGSGPSGPACGARPGRRVPPCCARSTPAPWAFALWDALLLSVHPATAACAMPMRRRLLAAQPTDPRARVIVWRTCRDAPSSTADLMLRALNVVVDGFWRCAGNSHASSTTGTPPCCGPMRFADWGALLRARLALHESWTGV